MNLSVTLCGLLVCWSTMLAAKDIERVYTEEEGRIVVEVESVKATGSWEAETKLTGFTGACYYTWRGNDLFNTPGMGVLSYKIIVRTPGKYQLRIHNRHDFADSTEQNDCWTRMDGGKWLKTFSSRRGAWTWHSNHEYNHSKKIPAEYVLTAGSHTFEISGRSKGFSIDRFVLFAQGCDATDTSLSETCGMPQLPKLVKLARLLTLCEKRQFGSALRTAEAKAKMSRNEEEAAEAKALVTCLREYAVAQRENLTKLKEVAPCMAVSELETLAKAYTGSDLGRHLSRMAAEWKRDPSVVKAQKARKILAIAEKAADKIGSGDLEDRKNRRHIRAITKAIAELEKRYPDSSALKQAQQLASALGIAER